MMSSWPFLTLHYKPHMVCYYIYYLTWGVIHVDIAVIITIIIFSSRLIIYILKFDLDNYSFFIFCQVTFL